MNKDARLLPGHIVANHPEFIVETHESLEIATRVMRAARAEGRKFGAAKFGRVWAVVDIDAHEKMHIEKGSN